MKRYLISVLALGLVLIFFVPLLGAADTPKQGGTLRMAIRKDIIADVRQRHPGSG